ncbi:hypothetical protein [Mesorhizobium sp.]|uniref:COG3904 family protein n=1 Tax=Mesorhizobium sp. TaxID=1871066 RepID=UPI003BAA1786
MVHSHRLLALISALFLIVHASATLAAARKPVEPEDNPQMRFVVVRSSAPGCEPTCAEWISAEGTISPNSPQLLKNLLRTLGARKLPVVVDSPGGDVSAAIAMGRMIRQEGLDVAVGRTLFFGCQPDAKDCKENDAKGSHYIGNPYEFGSYCASACPLMLAGGVRRLVGPLPYLGVHQITTTFVRTKLLYRTTYRVVRGKKHIIDTKIVSRKNAGSYKTYEMDKALEKRLAAYLTEMGIGEGVLLTIKNTPASSIHQLVPDNMLRMHLVTSLDSVDLLTGAPICKTVPAAANCRVVTVSDIKRGSLIQ